MTVLAGASAAPLAATAPAAAQPPPGNCGRQCPSGPPVQQNGNDIVGRVQTQVDMLNSGDSGSGQPARCDWTVRETGEVRHDGTLRWRPPGQGHDYWARGWDGGVGNGTIYRFECWHPEMGCRDPAPSGIGCLGEAVHETFCGEFLCLFDAVNPQNLALLVVDQFVRTLGPPQPSFSPADESLVNLDTWMWVENLPPAGSLGPWSISVPGQTVSATASVDGISWEMGNGDTVACPIVTSQAAAEDVCEYQYQRSSLGQPDNRYQGTVSVNWHVVWTGDVLGIPVGGELDAPRAGDFSLAVSESQALNTDG